MPLDIFSKTPLPQNIPADIGMVVDELKKSSGREECLKKTFNILINKYQGNRTRTYTKLHELLFQDIEKLWGREGFLHCTNINYVLRTLLVKSGFFNDEDVRLRWTQVWFVSPHQYAQVNVDGKWVDVDIWAKTYGTEFGNHARGPR